MSGTARRGRPPGRVEDRPTADGYAFDPGPRIGWLLRSNRLAHLPGSSARQFASMLGSHGVTADASRVSRWETGHATASLEVLEAYERLLDLDPGGLRAVATFLRRVGTGVVLHLPSVANGRRDHDWLERRLDAVVDGDPDGRVWFEFALSVATVGDRLVLPRSLWRDLTHRLVRQIGLSVGNAYLGRVEAATLLTRHPAASRALLLSIGAAVTEPDMPLISDPMSSLQEVEGHQAADLVLRLLEQDHVPIRNGAAWAAAAKIGRGHFDADELARLERVCVRLVRAHGLERGGDLSGVVDLVEVLPAASRAVVLAAAGHELAGAADPSPAATAVQALVARAVARLPQEDPMLERLIELSLVDERVEHRFLATFTLHQSPYRQLVARTAAEVLAEYVVARGPADAELAHRLIVALSVLGGPEEGELMLRMAEDPTCDLRAMALVTLAHLPPQSLSRRPHLESLLEGPSETLARTATYCAGMTGDPMLRSLVDREDVPEGRRRTARWWVDHGPAIHERPQPAGGLLG